MNGERFISKPPSSHIAKRLPKKRNSYCCLVGLIQLAQCKLWGREVKVGMRWGCALCSTPGEETPAEWKPSMTARLLRGIGFALGSSGNNGSED